MFAARGPGTDFQPMACGRDRKVDLVDFRQAEVDSMSKSTQKPTSGLRHSRDLR